MGYKGAKRFPNFSSHSKTTTIVSTPPKLYAQQRPRFNGPTASYQRSHSNKRNATSLPLRSKVSTTPFIPLFIPWDPESSPEPAERARKVDEAPSHWKEREAARKDDLSTSNANKAGEKRLFSETEEGDTTFYSRRAKHTKLDDSTEDITNRAVKVANFNDYIEKRRAQATQLRRDTTLMPAKSQLGLSNFRLVLCYRSSLMQCLLHLPPIINWLFDFALPQHCVSDDPQNCFTCLFRKLAVHYWNGQKISVATLYKEMDALLLRHGWTERGQADPDEMLLFFLKRFRAELPSSIFRLIETTFLSFWQQKIRCTKCDRVSLTKGAETKLSVPLSPRLKNGTLSAYLRSYFQDRVSYTCDGCKDTRDRAKIRTFISPADILCIQLSLVDKFMKKINYSADIPTELDLSSLCDGANGKQIYDLKSVVKHSGGASSGHYVACVIDPDGRWKLFDDSSVSGCNARYATSKDINQHGGPSLLFFQRRTEGVAGK